MRTLISANGDFKIVKTYTGTQYDITILTSSHNVR